MFDPAIVTIILAGAAGLSVVGITEMIKRFLNATGFVAYVISLIVSAAATLYYLLSTASFSAVTFIGYTIFVFLTANGIFKATHSPNT